MNNNINLNIAKVETALNMFLSDLPVGVAYLLLKNKLQEIQPLFQQQVLLEEQKEKQQSDQDNQTGQE